MLNPSHPLLFSDPQAELQKLITSGLDLIQKIGLTEAVLGVSGGVDSSLSLYLAIQIFGSEHVHPFILPYADQPTTDALAVCHHLQIEPQIICIESLVQVAAHLFPTEQIPPLRLGNFMARARMMILFDRASLYQGLVVGTENLSEKNLGYFTLHGDSASALEPINHLYKTQVIQLAAQIFPPRLAERVPSAELWPDQTDESELGFTYSDADRIMAALWPTPLAAADQQRQTQLLADISPQIIDLVLARLRAQAFKQELPYSL